MAFNIEWVLPPYRLRTKCFLLIGLK